MRLVPYHTRLAWKSLRRDPGLSATIVTVLAICAAIFSTALIHFLRIYGPQRWLTPALHQVEIKVDDRVLRIAFAGSTASPNRLAPHTRVSYPNYRVLAGSGIPARQVATFHGRAWVAADASAVAAGVDAAACAGRPRNVRFVSADFFDLFREPLRWGSPWSRDDETAGRPRVVIGHRFNIEIFGGGDSTGRTIQVDGRPFVVAGVLAQDQPVTPEWDPATSGGGQDAVYLPFPEHQRLQSWPETPLYFTPVGPRYADLLASDAVFVSFWVELPTDASRVAYARFLQERLGRQGVAYQLRDLARRRQLVRFPQTVFSFFTLLTLIIFVGAGLIVGRLLLAKGLVRGEELGIYRALGAPRAALFWRQIIEATMLSLAAAALGTLIAVPQTALYNRFVRDNDIPLRLTGLAVFVLFAVTVTIGVASAIYPGWMAARRRPTLTLGRA